MSAGLAEDITGDLNMERNADYEWRDRIRNKWVVDQDRQPHGSGNLEMYFAWVDGASRWLGPRESMSIPWSERQSMSAVIRSPMLLYRLACTFDADVKLRGESGYKSVWHINVMHKETSTRVGFGEHKGASCFWTKFYSIDGGSHDTDIAPPKAFLDDLKDLIDYLASDVCAHPYDGLVAGEIA